MKRKSKKVKKIKVNAVIAYNPFVGPSNPYVALKKRSNSRTSGRLDIRRIEWEDLLEEEYY